MLGKRHDTYVILVLRDLNILKLYFKMTLEISKTLFGSHKRQVIIRKQRTFNSEIIPLMIFHF